MFDMFFEGIKDIYNSVDDFFDDVSIPKGVYDVVSKAAKGYTDSSKKMASKPLDLDWDDSVDHPQYGAMALQDALDGEEEAPKSANPFEIEKEWFDRMRGIANGS